MLSRVWSLRHREEQQAYCERFLTPVIADVELSRLSRVHFAQILAQAPTASVAAHLRRWAHTPTGTELAPMVERRLAEVGPDGLLFPSFRGRWPRGSNYRRNPFNPAATAAGWLRSPEGRWAWSFHLPFGPAVG
ncbi:MAG: hypothetical protein KY452_01660 [Actinobacteria bacterium]|nr:hypothetical protein [Actinomycetota bacterium]